MNIAIMEKIRAKLTPWANSSILSILVCVILTACSLSDGGRQLVLSSNNGHRGSVCIESPVQAYIDGIRCPDRSPITRFDANARLDVIRGGCALEYAIRSENLNVFKEFIAKGGDLKRCPGYPASIYGAVTQRCRDNSVLAHQFFEVLEKQGTYNDNPQILLWSSAIMKCVEGVKLSLRFGATPNQPIRKNWDNGLLHPLQLNPPLEVAILEGWRGNPEGMIEIASILIDAGASPWIVDGRGESLFGRAEREYSHSEQWQKIRLVLLRARQSSELSN